MRRTAPQWRSSATTTSWPRPRATRNPSSGGASGNSSWPRGPIPDLLDRLAYRLLDAGAAVAGHGSKLARVLEGAESHEPDAVELEPPADPVHRAVAEQVEQLLVWDRAVRADTYDSVHQMRVTTRKIRSLLQASEDAFGISDDAWVLDELRQLAAVLGVARDAEVLAERYEKALDELPAELVRGPVRERLVEGAKKRYKSGLRRSLVAMRSQRYFRLLDALEGAGGHAGRPDAAGRGACPLTIDSAYKRVRKAAKAAAEAADTEEAMRRCTEFVRAPSDFGTPRRPPATARCPNVPRPSRRCSATIRTAWSAARI